MSSPSPSSPSPPPDPEAASPAIPSLLEGLTRIEPLASTSTSGLLHSVTQSGSALVVPVSHVEEVTGDDDSEEEEEEEEEISGAEEEEEVEEMPVRSDGPSAGLVEGEDGGTKVVVDPDGPPSPIIETNVIEEEEGDSEEESDDEDSEEDDDDDEEEEEPTLKYSRLGGEGIVELLAKDSVSSVAVSDHVIVLGTHNGAIFVFDFDGKILKRVRPHSAMVNDLSIDDGSDFVGSASMDGKIAIHSLSTPEAFAFDLRRPMRCVALEPNYGKRSTHQFVSGGMAGNLILHEKGWLGNKQETLHSGEGPIWAVKWRGNLIAWANDAGIRIYDTSSSQRITFISRLEDSPRADLFKCTLLWQDDTTLLIAWANFIKVAVVKEREGKRSQLSVGLTTTVESYVEVTSIFQVDCMISGIAPHGDSYLILAYMTEESFDNEATIDRDEQRRKEGSRPELRVISKEGEELSNDAISLRNYDKFQCRDYSLCPAPSSKRQLSKGKGKGKETEASFYVISPNDIVVARTRDREDHIAWLVQQKRYEEALHELEAEGVKGLHGFDVSEIGKKYLEYLVEDGQLLKAAEMTPKVLGINAKLWEDWVFLFADKGHLTMIIPFVPTHDPQLSRLVYEMILAHFLRHDPDALLRTIKSWPRDIYDIAAVILAVQDQLQRKPDSIVLTESLTELFVLNRQPGKALPYFIKLRRPEVFDLIRDFNLFTDVQDQAFLLIDFDQDIQKERKGEEPEKDLMEMESTPPKHGVAINLLVDHTHSIPIPRVVAQLQSHRKYLFMYLDALFDKDPHLAFDYSDLQVDLYAEYEPNKLMDFLRASNYYSLERAYKVCDAKDLVPEMVFLLGRMGDNKRALNLIIERLGDVQRAIEFAKEQNDHDLWEDLLKYSETKPTFIRGLLENVGAEIDPIRLIRRIKNGLEIPGLKLALIKILQDFNLQISLMEGCKTILYSDCRQLALSLHDGQTNGYLWTGATTCEASNHPIFPQLSGASMPSALPSGIHYLCGHTYDGQHAFPGEDMQIPTKRDHLLATSLLQEEFGVVDSMNKAMGAKLRMAMDLKGRRGGCLTCSRNVRLA